MALSGSSPAQKSLARNSSCAHLRVMDDKAKPSRGKRSAVTLAIVLGGGMLYALVIRLSFGWLGDAFVIVSAAFIFTMPVALGALVCYLGVKWDRPRKFWRSWAPAFSMILAVAGSYAVQMEALMCIVVVLPVVVPLAIFGGLTMYYFLEARAGGRLMISFLVLLPYGVAPLEALWQLPQEVRSMHDQIDIRATPEEVWAQIHEVPAIQRDELPPQWVYLLGFPRPIAATLDRQGVGGKRHATFERDVSFFEEITLWDPPRKLAFTIDADPDFIPHTAFDQHIIVGGRFYDVLDGIYEIEPLGDGICRLHLTSTHRLSTRFNWYAGWWSEWIMSQIQGSILHVIRNRCEAR